MAANKLKVLIVDDEINSTQILAKVLNKKGYSVTEFNDSILAKDAIITGEYNIIISDLQMPGLSGMDLLKITPEKSLFIMITGYGSITSAVDSMKNGAFDYVNKPFNMDEFLIKVQKADEKIRMSDEIYNLKNIIENENVFHNMIGKSKKMIEVFEYIRNVGKVNVNVLIQGQSGTGKELVARAIHSESDRKDKNFVAINCSAIPENLLESELFGHIKGAFTGAINNYKGVFEQANNGTLFLDEIGEMPYMLQAKLLRVIENWEIKPLGSDKVTKVNVRLISATNKNIFDLIKENKFREDLFYRIATTTINLPPLSERKEDIPLLVFNYLKRLSVKFNKNITISTEALNQINNYNFKGNIRELENILEQAVLVSQENRITESSLRLNNSAQMMDIVSETDNVSLDELEMKYIIRVLEKTNGNKLKAAEILKINRKTLAKKLKDYNL
ncbi:MAG TPA: sigma-54 dependent transcriptional regulator [Ignavibacteria bacterium]|nr:sigma-54 dependent transcriptional regulator [Ignavibacteria bacterium]